MTLHWPLNAEVSFNCFVLERNINTKMSLRHQHHCYDAFKTFKNLYTLYNITVVQSLVIFSSLTTMM